MMQYYAHAYVSVYSDYYADYFDTGAGRAVNGGWRQRGYQASA